MEIAVVYSEGQLQLVGRSVVLYGYRIGGLYETYDPSEENGWMY